MFSHPRRINSLEDITTPPITLETLQSARTYIYKNTSNPEEILEILEITPLQVS